jgi:hypothetical protein
MPVHGITHAENEKMFIATKLVSCEEHNHTNLKTGYRKTKLVFEKNKRRQRANQP